MKIYDYSNSELFVIGDIHGEFKRFFNLIKNSTSIDDDIEYEMHHLEKAEKGKKRRVNIKAKSPKLNIYDNSVIIVLGDCGIGFNKAPYYIDLFSKYNELFSKVNTTILFMRGNHDNPHYFNGEVINFSHIKTIPDYSVVKTKTSTSLCIGGAISVDRTWRKQQEALINRYKKTNKKELYWDDENCFYDEDTLKAIIDSEIKIDSILTHTSPDFAFPIEKSGLKNWLKVDNKLSEDVKNERETLTKIFNLLSCNSEIKFWCYGHYHMFNQETKNINNKEIILIALGDDYHITSPNGIISTNDMLKNMKLSPFINSSLYGRLDMLGVDNLVVNIDQAQPIEQVGDNVDFVDELLFGDVVHNEDIRNERVAPF